MNSTGYKKKALLERRARTLLLGMKNVYRRVGLKSARTNQANRAHQKYQKKEKLIEGGVRSRSSKVLEMNFWTVWTLDE